VRPLEQRLGWDGVDEARAVLHGWRIETIRTLPFFHYRRMGERDGMRRAYRDQGATSWWMGYRPSYLVVRSLFNARRSPAALSMIVGYAVAAARKDATLRDDAVRAFIRDRQRIRELVRRVREALDL
jgi:hypothetical protein